MRLQNYFGRVSYRHHKDLQLRDALPPWHLAGKGRLWAIGQAVRQVVWPAKRQQSNLPWSLPHDKHVICFCLTDKSSSQYPELHIDSEDSIEVLVQRLLESPQLLDDSGQNFWQRALEQNLYHWDPILLARHGIWANQYLPSQGKIQSETGQQMMEWDRMMKFLKAKDCKAMQSMLACSHWARILLFRSKAELRRSAPGARRGSKEPGSVCSSRGQGAAFWTPQKVQESGYLQKCWLSTKNVAGSKVGACTKGNLAPRIKPLQKRRRRIGFGFVQRNSRVTHFE